MYEKSAFNAQKFITHFITMCYVFEIVENYAFNGWWKKTILIFAKGKISIKSFKIDALKGNGMRISCYRVLLHIIPTIECLKRTMARK